MLLVLSPYGFCSLDDFVILKFLLQKRESGLATLISTDGDKSSEIKSFTAPSTPQAESINCPTEPRISNSLITESTPSSDLLLEVAQNREVPDDHFSGQETPFVSDLVLLIFLHES